MDGSVEKMTIVLKSSKKTKYWQVVSALFFLLVYASFFFVTLSGDYLTTDPVKMMFLYAVASSFIVLLLLPVVKSWFQDFVVVTLDGNILSGKPLLGKEAQLNVNSIVKVAPIRYGFRGLAFYNGEGVRFAPDIGIDAIGFLYDYILQRLPSNVEKDRERIDELRKDSDVWSYSIDSVRHGDYSEAQLDTIKAESKSMYDQMRSGGTLSEKIHYDI